MLTVEFLLSVKFADVPRQEPSDDARNSSSAYSKSKESAKNSGGGGLYQWFSSWMYGTQQGAVVVFHFLLFHFVDCRHFRCHCFICNFVIPVLFHHYYYFVFIFS